MPTAENMQRLSQGGRGPDAPDEQGYEMPTAENMQRLSAASPKSAVAQTAQPAAAQFTVAQTVVNIAWHPENANGGEYDLASSQTPTVDMNEYDLASQSPATDTANGQDTTLQETDFGVGRVNDEPPQDGMFKEWAGGDAAPGGGDKGKRSKVQGGKIKKGGQQRISLAKHGATSTMVANPLHQGTSA